MRALVKSVYVIGLVHAVAGSASSVQVNVTGAPLAWNSKVALELSPVGGATVDVGVRWRVEVVGVHVERSAELVGWRHRDRRAADRDLQEVENAVRGVGDGAAPQREPLSFVGDHPIPYASTALHCTSPIGWSVPPPPP